MDHVDLRDHVIAVIGAEGEMGKSCVRSLIGLGATVSISSDTEIQDEPTADPGMLLDVLNRMRVSRGRIDAIVVASSVEGPKVQKSSTGEADVIGAAVVELVRSARAGLEVLRSQGQGRLVLVAPGPAFPVPGSLSLGVISSALLGLTRCLGSEAESGPVRVNAVAPIADLPSTAALFDSHPYLERGRYTPDTVGSIVAFLCHNRCELRGEVFSAGGGRVARVAGVTAAGIVADHPELANVEAGLGRIRALDRCIEPRTVLDEFLLIDV